MTAPRPLLDYGRMLDVLRIEGELLVAAAEAALPDSAGEEVPGCPGRTLGETVRHVGAVYRATTLWVRHGQRPAEAQRAPRDGDLGEFVRAGVADLVDELAGHDPRSWCDTWWPADRTHGFWWRRMAHETTVHRVDIQAAAGGPVDPIDDDVAVDGVDEVMFLWFEYRLSQLGMTSPHGGTVGLSAGDRHWLAVLEHGRNRARRTDRREARSADAVVAGEPMNLYLWAWGRVPDQSVDISGDEDASASLWALLRPATQ